VREQLYAGVDIEDVKKKLAEAKEAGVAFPLFWSGENKKAAESKGWISAIDGRAKLDGLAKAYTEIGYNLTKQGRHEEAGTCFKKSLDANELICAITDANDRSIFYPFDNLGQAYDDMGGNLTKQNKIQEAGEYYQKLFDFLEMVEKMEHHDGIHLKCTLVIMFDAYQNTADAHAARGQMEEAALYYKKTIGELERIHLPVWTGAAVRRMPLLCEKIGDILTKLGKTEEAEEYYKNRDDKFEKIITDLHTKTGGHKLIPLIPEGYKNLADYLNEQGKTELARQYYKKAEEAKALWGE
jgi:tetratricopeptide (TPR) repeat protein